MKTNAIPMLRKSTLFLGAAAGAMLLASCGGNTTPDGNTTPTPTPSETPTPTPTATPTDIDFGADFIANSSGVYIYAMFTPNGGIEVFSDATRLQGAGGINFTFDPERVLYIFPEYEPVIEFLAAHLTASSPTMRTYVNGDQSLFLELPFGETLRVSYERNDSDIVGTELGNLRSRRVTLFANPITTTDDITTDLAYTGQPDLVGGTLGETDPTTISFPARTFDVNATNSTVSGTIQVFEDTGGGPTLIAELSFSTPVGGNGSFASTFTDDTFDFEGAFSGSLVGPDRDELLMVFSASHADGRKFVGSFIGAQP